VADAVSTRPLIDKLGVRPGARVALVDIDNAGFRELLAERTQDITDGLPLPGSDVVFVGIDDGAGLGQLPFLRERIVSNGAIWVVSRKGRAATLRDIEVIEAAKAFGLVDNKVVAFSEKQVALRLCIPIKLRNLHGSGAAEHPG
jgi:hypothetical protein